MPQNKAYGAIRSDVPHNLREIRQQRGMSIAELAGALGVEVTTVQRYETQPQRLRVHQLRTLAQALDCSVLELVDDGSLADMRRLSSTEAEALDALESMSDADKRRALDILKTLAGSASRSGAA